MTSPLLILGASTRALAQSAARASYQPWCADLFADQDLRAIAQVRPITRYPAEFLRAIEEAPAAPWVYTGGLENYPLLVERLAKKRQLWGNGLHALRAARSPLLVQQIARMSGLRPLAILLADAGNDRMIEHSRDVRDCFLVKPLRSAGGMGIRELAKGEAIGHRDYAQQQVDGESIAAIFVASREEVRLLGATRQLHETIHPRGKFVYAGSVGPVPLSEIEAAQLTTFVQHFSFAYGLIGLVGLDCIRTDEGLAIVEFNPRYTASVEVLERSFNVPVLAMHIAACCGEKLSFDDQLPQRTTCTTFGKRVVYAQQTCRAPIDIPLAEDWADVPHPGEWFEPGMPLLTVFASGDSVVDVEQKLIHRVAEVHRYFGAIDGR